MKDSAINITPMQVNKQAVIDKVDAIFAPWNRSDRPGYVVGIAHHGKVLYRKGLGLANTAFGIANTPATRMRIGSTSKHFTCLAAFLLQEDGKLDVNAPVRRYLPELRQASEPSVLQLMHHTSGCRDTIGQGMLGSGIAVLQGAGMPMLRARQQTGVNFAPGERMMYNNGAYHLLSLIIERLADMPFEVYLKTRIFDPLGMSNTDSYPDDDHQYPGVATLHVPDASGGYRRGGFPTRRLLGEGAMVSTVDDMLRWLAHLRGDKQVGSVHTWQQMLARPFFTHGVQSPYAAGLFINDYRGVEVIQHSGGVIGGACQMLTVPAHALDIIYMTNGAADADLLKLCNRMIEAVLGDEILGAPLPTPAKPDDYPSLPGWYVSPGEHDVYEIMTHDNALSIREMDGPPMPLYANGSSLEVEPSVFGPLTLSVPQASVAAASLQAELCGKPLWLTRLPTANTSADAAAAELPRGLPGTYGSAEMGAIATISVDGGRRFLDLQVSDGHTRYGLEAVAGNVVRFMPADASNPLSGILLVNPHDTCVPRFRLCNYCNRHVEFTRAEGGDRAWKFPTVLEMA